MNRRKALPVNGQPELIIGITSLLWRRKVPAYYSGSGGPFRLFLYDFQAMYVAHIVNIVDMNAIIILRISYSVKRPHLLLVFCLEDLG